MCFIDSPLGLEVPSASRERLVAGMSSMAAVGAGRLRGNCKAKAFREARLAVFLSVERGSNVRILVRLRDSIRALKDLMRGRSGVASKISTAI